MGQAFGPKHVLVVFLLVVSQVQGVPIGWVVDPISAYRAASAPSTNSIHDLFMIYMILYDILYDFIPLLFLIHICAYMMILNDRRYTSVAFAQFEYRKKFRSRAPAVHGGTWVPSSPSIPGMVTALNSGAPSSMVPRRESPAAQPQFSKFIWVCLKIVCPKDLKMPTQFFWWCSIVMLVYQRVYI